MKEVILVASLGLNILLLVIHAENHKNVSQIEEHSDREKALLHERLKSAADLLRSNKIDFPLDYPYDTTEL
jgi:hypothetical protein